MPSARIIVLEKRPAQAGLSLRYVLWVAVPAENQIKYANTLATSAYNAISAPDLAELRAGQFKELIKVRQFEFPPETTAIQKRNAIQNALEAEWALAQNEITNETIWEYFGRQWNGVAWSNP